MPYILVASSPGLPRRLKKSKAAIKSLARPGDEANVLVHAHMYLVKNRISIMLHPKLQ